MGSQDEAVEVPAKVKRTRWANVERLRILAMLEIIGFHAASERFLLLGGVGLPIFLVLTNLFNCTVSERRGFERFTGDKFRRLVYPWLFWCAVYAVANASFAIRHGIPLSDEFDVLMVLYGTNIHLWFVPFAFLSGVFVAYGQSRTRSASHIHTIAYAAVFGVALLLFAAYVQTLGEYRPPFAQYVYAVASPFIGFLLGRTLLIPEKEKQGATLFAVCLGFMILIPVAMVLPINLFAARYALAAILCGAALWWPGKSDRVTEMLTPLLFGIYLVHPLIIRLTKRWPVFDDYIGLYIIAIFIMSAVVVKVMQKSGLARWV